MWGEFIKGGQRGAGTKSRLHHELLAGWGWKSMKDQCKVLSASLIGTRRVVLEAIEENIDLE